MIKYCCYYCLYFIECQAKGKPVCYNAMGGLDYMRDCRVVDGVCDDRFDNGKWLVAEAHKDCWEER